MTPKSQLAGCGDFDMSQAELVAVMADECQGVEKLPL